MGGRPSYRYPEHREGRDGEEYLGGNENETLNEENEPQSNEQQVPVRLYFGDVNSMDYIHELAQDLNSINSARTLHKMELFYIIAIILFVSLFILFAYLYLEEDRSQRKAREDYDRLNY